MVRIRTNREIQLITESCQIVADTLEKLSAEMLPGKSILELDRIAEEYILDQNAKPAFKGYRGYPSTLCVSVDDEVVHGIPNNRKLKEGEIISVDVGSFIDGFYGDHAKTFSIGQETSLQRKETGLFKRRKRK